jgi:hypothetical protein
MVLVGKSEGKIPCAGNMFLRQNYAEIKIFLHSALITKMCKILSQHQLHDLCNRSTIVGDEAVMIQRYKEAIRTRIHKT